MKNLQAATLGLSMVLSTTMGQAQEIQVEDPVSGIVISAGLGILAIESREHVFQRSGSPDHLSLLIWQSAAPVLTTTLEVDLPDAWTLRADTGLAVAGDSAMEDYDWIVRQPNSPDLTNWSHRSQHPDTRLDWYFNGSVQLGYDVEVKPEVTLNVHGGAEYTDVQWSAFDGSFVYSSDPGFRDLVGTFTGGRGVSYRQQLPNLFVGLRTEIQQEAWSMDLGAKAGITLLAATTDHHWWRDLRFSDQITSAPTLGASAGVRYRLDTALEFAVSAEVDRVFLGRSDTFRSSISTGQPTGSTADAGGAELVSASIKAGVTGKF